MWTHALQSSAPGTPLERTRIHRRELRPDDVDVAVSFCGVCHSDLHAMRTPLEQGGVFPLVPGHEFVGEVVAVGDAVTEFRSGDSVAVGNIVDSCGECALCRVGQENFCLRFPTLTYGGRDRHDGTVTAGAYAGRVVVRDRFVFHRPPSLDPAGVAPLMCAGITVWEPLRSADVGPGTRLGVVGIGGLGHLAVRLGAALGAEVTVFTTSPGKAADATELGASHVVLSTDAKAMADAGWSLDVIIDTVSVAHDLSPYLRALDLDGTLFTLGHLGPMTLQTTDLLIGRKRISSAGSGGHPRTQELLDFCEQHGLVADVEVIGVDEISNALERLAANDVRYRFALDVRSLDTQPAGTEHMH